MLIHRTMGVVNYKAPISSNTKLMELKEQELEYKEEVEHEQQNTYIFEPQFKCPGIPPFFFLYSGADAAFLFLSLTHIHILLLLLHWAFLKPFLIPFIHLRFILSCLNNVLSLFPSIRYVTVSSPFLYVTLHHPLVPLASISHQRAVLRWVCYFKGVGNKTAEWSVLDPKSLEAFVEIGMAGKQNSMLHFKNSRQSNSRHLCIGRCGNHRLPEPLASVLGLK